MADDCISASFWNGARSPLQYRIETLAVHIIFSLSKLTESLKIPLFFFLMIRPPPISSLFPYTTLFRSRPGSGARAPARRLWPFPAGLRHAGAARRHSAPDRERGLALRRRRRRRALQSLPERSGEIGRAHV